MQYLSLLIITSYHITYHTLIQIMTQLKKKVPVKMYVQKCQLNL